MTDRELLEAAAKAAGIKVRGYYEDEASLAIKPGPGLPTAKWNPLTDDGDALRLAVKLKMRLARFDAWGSDADTVQAECEWHVAELAINDDPYAATRRAIVRAAAELGRSKT